MQRVGLLGAGQGLMSGCCGLKHLPAGLWLGPRLHSRVKGGSGRAGGAELRAETRSITSSWVWEALGWLLSVCSPCCRLLLGSSAHSNWCEPGWRDPAGIPAVPGTCTQVLPAAAFPPKAA